MVAGRMSDWRSAMLADIASRPRFIALLHACRMWGCRNAAAPEDPVSGASGQASSTSDHDASHTPLLIERMLALRLEPEDVRRADPAMFGEFQARCRLCESPGQCAWSLVHLDIDPAWQDWRNYCPNSAKLRMLSALRGCAFDSEG
jgi:hypothetical protein